MPPFKLDPIFTPTADQPKAIDQIVASVEAKQRFVTLLGATGTGKTMTMAGDDRAPAAPGARHGAQQDARRAALQRVPHVLPRQRGRVLRLATTTTTSPRPTSRRKDLYIEKDSAINQEIDRLRHAATAALFGRRDVIIVASVSAIFGMGSPETYDRNMVLLKRGDDVDRDELLRKLVSIQYTRNDTALGRGELPRAGRVAGDLPGLRGVGLPRAAVRRRDRAPAALRPADRRADRGRHRARRHLAGDALQRQGGHDRGGRRRDRARAQRAHRRARGRGQAARVPPAAPAHAVRHGDAARDGLLQRHRELLAHPRRPHAGRPAVLPASTTSPTTSSASWTSPTRPCRSSAACTRATARASRRSSTTASGCRPRSTTARRRSTSSWRSRRRSCSSRRRRASSSARTPTAWSSRSCARRASSTRRSRCARRATRSTT